VAGTGGSTSGTGGAGVGGGAGFGPAAGTSGGAGLGNAGQGGTVASGGQAGGDAGRSSAAGASTGGALGSSGGAGSAGAPAGGAAGSASTSCTDTTFAICEDFENTADGALPSGWTKTGDAGAATDQAHRGMRALKLGAAASGARRMRLTGARVEGLGGAHWGRLFYKVQTPAPRPSSGVIHSTIVAFDAMSPISGTIEVRVVDTVENDQGAHQYLYNVQPNGRSEFGKGGPYSFEYDGAWYCTEWYVDHATQRYRFFVDGVEHTPIGISNGAGNFEDSELPSAFTALSIGWNNYQQAPDGGFVAWIDDVALGSERVGCN
jgi:hypothetical protein